MITGANIQDPAQVALLLLRLMDQPATGITGRSALEVLKMCQQHGTSFAQIGRYMDVIPLEAAYHAPAAEVPKR